MHTTLSSDLPREIAPGVTWIGACLEFPVGETIIHGHTSNYVVVGTEKAVMVDTGNPSSWPEISAILDEVVGDRELAYVFPTHPELPHSGNLARVVAKYPDIEVIGDVRDYHLFYPDVESRLRPHVAGERFDLGGGHELVLVEAMIRDLPNTLWAYAPAAKVLFSADGFCYMHHPELDDEEPMHLPGECGLTTAELSTPPSVENAAFFTGSALYFSRFLDDSEERYARVAALVEELGAQIIAPTHGNVITEVAEVMAIVQAGHKSAYRFAKEPAAASGAIKNP